LFWSAAKHIGRSRRKLKLGSAWPNCWPRRELGSKTDEDERCRLIKTEPKTKTYSTQAGDQNELQPGREPSPARKITEEKTIFGWPRIEEKLRQQLLEPGSRPLRETGKPGAQTRTAAKINLGTKNKTEQQNLPRGRSDRAWETEPDGGQARTRENQRQNESHPGVEKNQAERKKERARGKTKSFEQQKQKLKPLYRSLTHRDSRLNGAHSKNQPSSVSANTRAAETKIGRENGRTWQGCAQHRTQDANQIFH
jgi:hypothetical protein